MKKILAFVLAIILMFTMLPLNAFAYGDEIIGISVDDVSIPSWNCDRNGIFDDFDINLTTYFESGSSHYEFFYYGREGSTQTNYGELTFSDTQDIETWVGGNTYEVTATFGEFSTTFNVEVYEEENPVLGIDIDDCYAFEQDDGEKWFYYFSYCEVALLYGYNTYNTGASLVHSLWSDNKMWIDGYYYKYELVESQPSSTWEVGETYEVTVYLCGASDTFNVTVVEIESIEIEDLELIENVDGYYTQDSYWDDEAGEYVESDYWFKYNVDPDIIVNLTNGESIVYSQGEFRNITGEYYPCYYNQSYNNQWVVGESYTVTFGNDYNYDNKFVTEFTVTIVETPVESIIVEDISHIVGTNQYWYLDDEHTEEYPEYVIRPQYITVNFKNGDPSVSGSYDEVCEQLGYYGEWDSDQSYDNRWGIGTHTATFNFMGVTTEYNVEITSGPIASIDVEDVEIIDGDYDYYDEEIGHYYEPYMSGTVTYTDGTTEDFWGGFGLYVEDNYYYMDSNYWSAQYEKPWVLGGTYEVTATILGASDTFNVTIVENPIESIEVEDVEIIEGDYNGWDSELGDFYGIDSLRGTVTFKDGTTKEFRGDIYVGDDYYWVSDNSWELQHETPWVAGETYEVTATVLGVTSTFNVTIVETPIESIEIEDVEIIEGDYNGWDSELGDYYGIDILRGTVTFKDGTTEEFRGDIYIGDNYYWFSDNSWELQHETPWLAGETYEVTAEVLGVTSTFNVTIVETPIESIEIDDVKILEGNYNGSYNDIPYYSPSFTGTVTYKDGTSQKFSYNIEIGDDWFSFESNAMELQLDEPWVAGETYEVTATILGVSDTFNVTITPTPVECIMFKDIVVYQGVDGDGEYNYITPELLAVLLKNGTLAELDGDSSIKYGGENYYVNDNSWDLQNEEPWEVGKTYEVTGTLLGVSDTFKVTVKENPIEKIEFIELPDKTEYILGESINLKGATIRINYSNGEYEDIVIDNDYTAAHDRNVYSEIIDRTGYFNVFYGQTGVVGEGVAEVEIFNQICTFPITVKNGVMESVTVRENADKTLTITVTNTDSSSYEMKLLDISSFWYGDENEYSARVFTDKGEFRAVIYDDGESFSMELYYYDEEQEEYIYTEKSNSIPSPDWFKTAIRAFEASWNMSSHYDQGILELKNYNGKLTADNIDDIASFAVTGMYYYDAVDYVVIDGVDYEIFKGEDVREALSEYFGFENVDLTLSENYDADTDTFKTSKFPRSGGEPLKDTTSDVSYSNGVWKIKSSHYGTTTILKLNDEQKIIGFTIGSADYTPGDVDNDGEVTLTDIVALAQYVAEWEVDCNESALDTNGDGNVDLTDVVHLAQYVAEWDGVELH